MFGIACGPAMAAEATAVFAGGCFWCVEADFEKLPGVTSAVSGYAGGTLAHPAYEQVSAGGTGHAEAVAVHYDPAQVGYEKLLDWFWHHVDPTVKDQQFCDHGSQYRTVIFYGDESQKRLAEASKAAVEKQLKRPVHTQIAPAGTFWPAEDYHQDYARKNPLRYKFYRSSCGRDERVQEIWGAAPH
ncbi:MAG TPA: peptide-methionine (S)-S-oxide reductase MsrA [Candidatus Binatia bacterium]|nr:peptide-methionine (S)-S-oxide reductase MsrA [Candidatus Binatia bacterium]